MKKTLVFLFLCLSILSFSRVVIQFQAFEYPDMSPDVYASIINNIKSELTSSQRFTVLSDNNIRQIFDEYTLSYIFNGKLTDNLKSIESDILAVIKINDYNFRLSSNNYDFIENNYSGNYLKKGSDFIRVESGKYYEYVPLSNSYVLSNTGNFVRGYDNNFYPAGKFYTQFNYTEKSISASYSLQYSIIDLKNSEIIKTGNINRSDSMSLLNYVFDKTTNKPLKKEKPASEIFENLSAGLGSIIYNDIKEKFKIDTYVKAVEGKNVYFDGGKDKGIVNGYVFETKSGSEKADIKILHTNELSAEGIIINSSEKMTVVKGLPASENFRWNFRFPVSFCGYYSDKAGMSIYFNFLDIYQKYTGYFGLSTSFNEKNIIESVDAGIVAYRNGDLYVIPRISFMNVSPAIGSEIRYGMIGGFFDYQILNSKFRFGASLNF